MFTKVSLSCIIWEISQTYQTFVNRIYTVIDLIHLLNREIIGILISFSPGHRDSWKYFMQICNNFKYFDKFTNSREMGWESQFQL